MSGFDTRGRRIRTRSACIHKIFRYKRAHVISRWQKKKKKMTTRKPYGWEEFNNNNNKKYSDVILNDNVYALLLLPDERRLLLITVTNIANPRAWVYTTHETYDETSVHAYINCVANENNNKNSELTFRCFKNAFFFVPRRAKRLFFAVVSDSTRRTIQTCFVRELIFLKKPFFL